MLMVAFALAVIGFARWRGLTALAGLAVTFAVLLLFVIPAILDGKPPLLAAIVGSAAIMLVVLYLTHGVTVPTSMALLGTLVALTLTGVLSAVTTAATKLTGIASEEAAFLSVSFRDVDMRGLLLAGILIGSLGVLDGRSAKYSAASCWHRRSYAAELAPSASSPPFLSQLRWRPSPRSAPHTPPSPPDADHDSPTGLNARGGSTDDGRVASHAPSGGRW